MVKRKVCKRPSNKTEQLRVKKHRPPETTLHETESIGSQSTVSLSDSDFAFRTEEDTLQRNGGVVVSLTDLESTENESQEETKSTDSEGITSSKKPIDPETYRQELSVFRCRYRAELERVEDEIASAENSYFGTRRTRVGSILKGYADYASSNVEVTRNKKYCRPVKLGERVFSLSSRTSKIRKEYEEECKKEVMRRDAQLMPGYGYMSAGTDPQALDASLRNYQSRMGLEGYPVICQGGTFGYNMGGNMHVQHPEAPSPYGQQYPSFMYTPQNASHMFMNYDPRPQMAMPGPQMMGPSMRIESSQPFMPRLDSGADNTPVQQAELLLDKQSETNREGGIMPGGGNGTLVKKEEELVGGDSFDVEQYLNVALTQRPQNTENGH